MASPALLRCHFRFKPPLCITAELFSQCWQPLSSVEHEASMTGMFVWLRLGHMPGCLWETSQPLVQCQSALSTLIQASKHIYAPHKGSLMLVLPALQPAKGMHIPCVRHQDWGAQSVAQTTHSAGRISTCVTFLFLWVPSQRHGSQPVSFLPFLPNSVWIFLTTLLYRSLSSNFQLAFGENISACTYIFDVFMIRGVCSTSPYSAILIPSNLASWDLTLLLATEIL